MFDFDGVGTYRQDGEGEEAVGIASGLKVDTVAPLVAINLAPARAAPD